MFSGEGSNHRSRVGEKDLQVGGGLARHGGHDALARRTPYGPNSN